MAAWQGRAEGEGMNDLLTILCGDALAMLKTLPDESVQCCVTSPPYWGLRSYLPDSVQLKTSAPESIKKKLVALGIFPLDHTVE